MDSASPISPENATGNFFGSNGSRRWDSVIVGLWEIPRRLAVPEFGVQLKPAIWRVDRSVGLKTEMEAPPSCPG
ncbi:hypothetical protein CCR75_001708 [Bremia lactucae]|uniref:Uncharacterized protein n=1 Tax=Bremia lactucae TaxID=4779 RepID=A0A976FGE2_BRELC|nr:hypothetical protein CCR75_001708 [Bremia lactucae]